MPGVSVEFTCAGRGGSAFDSHCKGAIADAYCRETGARAEEQGSAAACINSMSDTGVAALRSRLSIPELGTAQATYALFAQLGWLFSIILMRGRWLYNKVLPEQGMEHRLASTRSIGVRPDTAERLDVPVINPGLVGYKNCKRLRSLGLTHSKAAWPAPGSTMDRVFLGA